MAFRASSNPMAAHRHVLLYDQLFGPLDCGVNLISCLTMTLGKRGNSSSSVEAIKIGQYTEFLQERVVRDRIEPIIVCCSTNINDYSELSLGALQPLAGN